TLSLHDALPISMHGPGERQLVGPVAHEDMLGPKTRHAAIDLAVIVVHHVRAAIRVILRIKPAGIVYRSGECIGELSPQTVREPFLRAQLERVVEGLRIADALRDAGEVRVLTAQL